MAKISPYELHPDITGVSRSNKPVSLTFEQLNLVVSDVIGQMYDSPNKTWGHSKSEVEIWLKMVIDEAKKVPHGHSDTGC